VPQGEDLDATRLRLYTVVEVVSDAAQVNPPDSGKPGVLCPLTEVGVGGDEADRSFDLVPHGPWRGWAVPLPPLGDLGEIASRAAGESYG
jgi:hypothetical protein